MTEVARVAVLQLTRSQRRRLGSIRRHAAPYEGCAMLLGVLRAKGTKAVVKRIVEMENVDQSPSQFAISPEREYQVLEAAAREGLDLVGIFHSHPAPPHPSLRDLQFMEHNPCAWLIDGIHGVRHVMKAYQRIAGQLYAVQVRTHGS